MEIDLNLHPAREATFRCQVCIVGAGIAGLTLAHRLHGLGIDVALLEAGGRGLDEAGSPDDLVAQAQFSGRLHRGTTQGNFRAFGGSSSRWGGQLLPLPNAPGAAWPISAGELASFAAAAERMLGVDDLPYAAAAFYARAGAAPAALLAQFPAISATFSKWTPFARRNLVATLGRELLASPYVRLYLHAQATEILLAPSRERIDAVLVRTLAGATFRFAAEHYVLAAGTVETSRLLLASRSVAPEGVGNAHDQVGRNFHDHLTVPVATLTGQARATLLDELRPWVFKGQKGGATLHSAKLEASPELRQRLALNPVLAHLTIEEPEDSGVAVLREILTARQRGQLAQALSAHAARLPRAALEAVRLAWSARLHHRRFVSANAVVRLRLNAAQDAPSLSRIRLGDTLDPFRLPLPSVDWRVSPHEIATLRAFATHLRERLAALGLDGIEWQSALFAPDEPLEQLDDARHAMGGACMGTDPRSSVVAPDLRVHGVANLYVASAATFPTGAPPLPTLPLMALSLRLADKIAAQLSQ